MLLREGKGDRYGGEGSHHLRVDWVMDIEPRLDIKGETQGFGKNTRFWVGATRSNQGCKSVERR